MSFAVMGLCEKFPRFFFSRMFLSNDGDGFHFSRAKYFGRVDAGDFVKFRNFFNKQ